MNLPRLPLAETLDNLPEEWPHDPLESIRSSIRESGKKVVVIDDDPTGAQTVYGVSVLTAWSVDALAEELATDLPAVYLLTNSRSLPPEEAASICLEAGRDLIEASRKAGRDVTVVSRSDSTLRGHFPGEVEALAKGMGQKFDAWILIPFFLEGGRYTINDVHYVAEGDWLVPAGETEFARDAAFGYKNSDLRQWVEEKTEGRIESSVVASVSIEDIRVGGPERVAQRLSALAGGTVCIVNAASMRDLEVFTQGLLEAEEAGRRFLYRTSASFLRARFGQSPRPILTPEEMDLPESGGALIVVGSHVPRTTEQLEDLLKQPGIVAIEAHVNSLLSDERVSEEASRVAQEAEAAMREERDVVVFTSRRVVQGTDAEESLSIARRISEGLVSAVGEIATRPRYILAKGGITASDIATKGLGVRRAMVPGQILPGVPVWQLGTESRYPGLKYIVFPGNVGDAQAITAVVTSLRHTT